MRLFAIDEIKGDLTTPGYSEPLTPEFLRRIRRLWWTRGTSMTDFTARLLEAIGDVDAQTDGVLLHSENFQALSLMQARYRERVKCVYIDPPYNTGSDAIRVQERLSSTLVGSPDGDRLRTRTRRC